MTQYGLHKRLIIHRDVNREISSPVTAFKLLDFGIAKILDVESLHQVESTRTLFRLLTRYTSEQVRGRPILPPTRRLLL